MNSQDKREVRVLVALSPTALSATSEGVLCEQQCDLGRCALAPSRKKSRSETADYRLCKINSTGVADDSESDGSWARTIDDGKERG